MESKKVALVTGGTGGIGTAICEALFKAGYAVVAGYYHGGNDTFAKAWQQSHKEKGFDFHICYANIIDFTSCEQMVRDIESEIGPISVLVNNAGITKDVTLKKMEPEQWYDVIKTNLDSLFNVTRNVINGMIDRQYGRIINIASINGQKGQFGQTNYAAAKAGIHGFTMSLAQEVAKTGITVNTISPGYVETDMIRKMSKEILDKIIAQIPVGRLAHPDEIARLVVFLAAEESGFMTGDNLAINGGQYMHA